VSGKKKATIPWAKLCQHPSTWIEPECAPDGFEWADPSKIRIGDVFRLLDHWRERKQNHLTPLIWVSSCPLLEDVEQSSDHHRRIQGQRKGRNSHLGDTESSEDSSESSSDSSDGDGPDPDSSSDGGAGANSENNHNSRPDRDAGADSENGAASKSNDGAGPDSDNRNSEQEAQNVYDNYHMQSPPPSERVSPHESSGKFITISELRLQHSILHIESLGHGRTYTGAYALLRDHTAPQRRPNNSDPVPTSEEGSSSEPDHAKRKVKMSERAR
jgi:hypothetical protein